MIDVAFAVVVTLVVVWVTLCRTHTWTMDDGVEVSLPGSVERLLTYSRTYLLTVEG